MELKQIASILNTVKIPNALGEVVTIADDLSNVGEGISVENMDEDTCKNYLKDLAVGTINFMVRTGEYPEETFGLYHNEIEYGGVLQVTRTRGRLKSYDSPILTLQSVTEDDNAPDYTDGHYYGTGFDSKLYTKDVIDEIRYSIPVEMFKQSFTSASEVQKLFALIEENAANTIRSFNKELARSILLKLIGTCSSARRIKLFTLFNTVNGLQQGDDDYVTLANYRSNHKFKLFGQQVLKRIQNQMLDYNKKYNDGTVEIFGKKSDLRTILLEDFYTDIEFEQSMIFHNELTSVGQVYTINFWQNASTDLMPCISEGSVHDQVKIAVENDDPIVIDHVIGLVMDKYVAGITNKVDKVRAKYVPEGDFNTMFHAILKKYWVDTRDMAVIFTLD